MIGRQVIKTNRAFTLQELEQFMQGRWDKEQYNDFVMGRPTKASVEEYILLPATERFMVIAYSRRAGGFFSKENKVILAVCNTPEGAKQEIFRSIHTHNAFVGIYQIGTTMSMEKERKGPAEEALQFYRMKGKTHCLQAVGASLSPGAGFKPRTWQLRSSDSIASK